MALLNGYRPLNFTGKHLVSFVGPSANKGRQEVDIENGLLSQYFQLYVIDLSKSTANNYLVFVWNS